MMDQCAASRSAGERAGAVRVEVLAADLNQPDAPEAIFAFTNLKAARQDVLDAMDFRRHIAGGNPRGFSNRTRVHAFEV